MGQSICFAEIRRENASKLKIQNSWVSRFVSPNYAWKMHQNGKFKIHGSIDLFRRITHGKCIKTEISKFMGQSICFAELRMENASKLKIQNSLVNRFVSPNYAWKMHQN